MRILSYLNHNISKSNHFPSQVIILLIKSSNNESSHQQYYLKCTSITIQHIQVHTSHNHNIHQLHNSRNPPSHIIKYVTFHITHVHVMP